MKSPSKKKSVKKDFSPPGRIFSLKRRQAVAEAVILRLKELMPEPRCELYYLEPYHLLVSVVLSAQTTDKMVNRVMTPLYDNGFDVDTALRLGETRLLQKIRTIGLAPTKAKNVIGLSKILKEKYAGAVPQTREALEALPGVGRKTANVVLGELFHQPTLAVDTHVYRVTMRLGLHRESSVTKAEDQLMKVVDPKFLPAAHHWFILLGRYTCKALKPLCSSCQLTDICPSYPTIGGKGLS